MSLLLLLVLNDGACIHTKCWSKSQDLVHCMDLYTDPVTVRKRKKSDTSLDVPRCSFKT